MELNQESISQEVSKVFDDYDSKHELPMKEYGILLSVFTLSFAGAYALSSRKGRTLDQIRARDILLLGVAAHKLSRDITKEKITSVLRAPFTEKGRSTGFAEVVDHSRGEGMRRALGDMLTCPFCLGMWCSSALGFGLLWAPRFTRFASSILSIHALADVSQIAYAKLKKL